MRALKVAATGGDGLSGIDLERKEKNPFGGLNTFTRGAQKKAAVASKLNGQVSWLRNV